jgi:ABC-2 type transport system ATP-binding protein
VEAICDRVIILLNGEIKADARLSELEASTDVILVLQDGAPNVTADLRALSGVRKVQPMSTVDGPAYLVQSRDGLDLRPAIYDLARHNEWPVKELRRQVCNLEAVFNELVTAAGGNGQ